MFDFSRPAEGLLRRCSGLVRIAQMPEIPRLIIHRYRARVVTKAESEISMHIGVVDRKGLFDKAERRLELGCMKPLQCQHAKPHAAQSLITARVGELGIALREAG